MFTIFRAACSAFIAVCVSAPCLAFERAALVCPPALTYIKVITKKGEAVIIEDCRNAANLFEGPFRVTRVSNGSLHSESTYKNGKLHGITKLYNINGDLLQTESYFEDDLVSREFTNIGLRAIVAIVNTSFDAGQRWYVPRDSKDTITFVFGTSNAYTGHALNAAEKQVLIESRKTRICEMYDSTLGINYVELRPLWTNGEVMMSGYISRDGCPTTNTSGAASASTR